MPHIPPHIPKDKWISNTYARSNSLCDVLREPIDNYGRLPESEKDKIRQTQLEPQEILQILGFHGQHALIKKWDEVIGWLSVHSFQIDPSVSELAVPASKKQSPSEFFETWKGTPYVWGGVTRAGIDCSGFSQRYYLDVHDTILPKNSKDQRKAGSPRPINEIQDHDLVFCHRKGGSGVHHVGVFIHNEVWHAQLERGVISQAWEDFRDLYTIEEITSHLL
jgi:hypothetical protein